MNTFPERNCPQCGKSISAGRSSCSCGYHESISDQELWEQINYYEKQEESGTRLIIVSGIMMGLGMMFGVAAGKPVLALPFLAIGIVLTLFGGQRSSRSNKYKNSLITDQIGPYAQEQYEEMIGPFTLSFEEESFRQMIQESKLIPAWNTFEGSYYIQGDFEGMEYSIGNVSLIYKQRGMNHGEDLDQDTYRFPALHGIWLHCDRKHDLKSPLYIRENGTEEKQRFKNVLPDQSHGQDLLAHKILTGKASFDERYAVYCEEEEAAKKVLDDEMCRNIEELRRVSEGKIMVELQSNYTNVAVQTPFLIYSHLLGGKMDHARGLKQGFLVNLHYQFRLMREVKRL